MEIDEFSAAWSYNGSTNQPTDDTAQLDALLQWMGPNNLRTSSLEPHHFPETGRGMRATQDLAAGTRLISVTSPFCYTAARARLFRPEIPPHLLEHPLDCLIIFLMLEDQLGAASCVAPYLRSLPRTFTNPLFSLRGRIPQEICSESTDLLRRQRGELFSSWRRVSATFCHLAEAVRVGMELEKFIWAFFVVNTRTLYVTATEPALVPFLDLFNHSPVARVQTRWNGAEDAFEIITECRYQAGEQVFINYGAHDNMNLAIHYGFTMPRNPLSEVLFDLGDVAKKLPVTTAQRDFLRSYGAWRPLSCSWSGFSQTAKLFLASRLVRSSDFWKTVDVEDLVDDRTTRLALVELLCDAHRDLANFAERASAVPLLQTVYLEMMDILHENLRVLEESSGIVSDTV
ncbi:putative SET domain-containing protein 4 [Hypsibius exemplaris]|uniref:SET domain-containing protein 4 n=1 Tax=Hypsibius exemplaris TaxID=2072580 RepID=A0A9X6NLE8_HYPEX|nr:putative SET domain-containing protein 4 [Hypsibius exemplaris]